MQGRAGGFSPVLYAVGGGLLDAPFYTGKYRRDVREAVPYGE